MYERYFGLRERPFDLTPNPRFLYLTTKHREALSTVQYGITGRKGITLLTGEAGTGKTTLIRAAIDSLTGPLIHLVYVNNPTLLRGEFYEYLARKMGLTAGAETSKANFLAELEQTLTSRHKAGATTALIIDEAQSLPSELMEEVRLLANFETDTEKLLPVVLTGQPELADRLEEPGLRQLKQRVALRCELQPLNLRETAAYIAGRISIAGGEANRVFTREAVGVIFARSQGIPRTISVLCDNALVTGFAGGVKPVGSEVVIEVCRDFHLQEAGSGDEAAVQQLPAGASGDQRAAEATVASVKAEAGANELREGVASRPVLNVVTEGPRQDPASRERPAKPERAAAARRQPAAAEPEPERPTRSEALFGLFTRRKGGRFF
jgi:general secretion pathway protein A